VSKINVCIFSSGDRLWPGCRSNAWSSFDVSHIPSREQWLAAYVAGRVLAIDQRWAGCDTGLDDPEPGTAKPGAIFAAAGRSIHLVSGLRSMEVISRFQFKGGDSQRRQTKQPPESGRRELVESQSLSWMERFPGTDSFERMAGVAGSWNYLDSGILHNNDRSYDWYDPAVCSGRNLRAKGEMGIDGIVIHSFGISGLLPVVAGQLRAARSCISGTELMNPFFPKNILAPQRQVSLRAADGIYWDQIAPGRKFDLLRVVSSRRNK